MTLHQVRVHNQLFVFDDESREQVEAHVREIAKRTGHAIYWPDGSKEFYEHFPIVDTTKEGSGQYQWHADNNRVRCEYSKMVVSPAGEVVRTVLRKTWKVLE